MDPKFERRKNIVYSIVGMCALLFGLFLIYFLPLDPIVAFFILFFGAFGGYYIGKVKGYKEIQLTCPECETINPSDAKFCKSCGEEL